MKTLKPSLTYEEQVDHLIQYHGLIIKDREKAIKILSSINYYRLTGYGIGLKSENNELYRNDITIDTIYKIYEFDQKCRSITFHLIETIEIRLRTQLAYTIAIKYGSEGYMDEENFLKIVKHDGITVHESIIENFKREAQREKNKPFVKHHFKKYGGHFPIWVTVELLTFGNLTSLYHIMKKEDQKEIAKLYNTRPLFFNSWLLSLLEVRNMCAHYVRLYNMPLKQRPLMFKEHKKYVTASKTVKYFSVVLVLKRITNANNDWLQFYNDLMKLIDEYKDVIDLSFIGFPNEWKEILQEPLKIK